MSEQVEIPEGEHASLATIAKAHGLHHVGGRPKLWRYLALTWQRRDFIWTLAQFRMRASLEGNRLGLAWLLLTPCFDALIYGLIFGLLQGPNRPPDYPVRVVIGVFLWQFFKQSFSSGAKSLAGNRSLVQSLSFPRMTLPLAEVCQHLISLVPSMALLVVILPVMGHPPTWSWLRMIPLLVLYTLFNTGMALIVARLTVHFRDLTQLLPYVTRLLFYTSGVLFDVSSLFERWPWVIRVYDFHPLYQLLQLARGALMGIQTDPNYWVGFGIFSMAVFVFGIIFFWVAEERYGRS